MNTESLIDALIHSYDTHGAVNFCGKQNYPNRQQVIEALHDLQYLLFPGFRTADFPNREMIKYSTGERIHRIISCLTKETQKALLYLNTKADMQPCFFLAEKTVMSLIEYLIELREILIQDVHAALDGDPAAHSIEEIILSYPGFQAITVYRIAHFLHRNGVPIIPRIMSEYVHGETGIDIHPGAVIGKSFFIDHGTGIVIGETCFIGDNVKIYQGVTLGALSVKKEMHHKKRHPTIEDNVTIYAGATILGGRTTIGKGSIIGGNTWVTASVPPNTTVTIG